MFFTKKFCYEGLAGLTDGMGRGLNEVGGGPHQFPQRETTWETNLIFWREGHNDVGRSPHQGRWTLHNLEHSMQMTFLLFDPRRPQGL